MDRTDGSRPVTGGDLDGRVAVVTGGAHGIGRRYALALAAAGAHVVVADLDEEGAAAVAGEVTAAGGRAEARRIDVSDATATRALGEDLRRSLGAVHVLVNNAAIYHAMRMDPVLEVDIEYWRRMFAVNLDGALLMTQALAPTMVEAGWGRVVNQTSVGAYAPSGAYSATKLALISLTQSQAFELGRHGITVNAIAPGPIDTEATRATLGADRVERLVAAAAIPRVGTPDDLVGALLFLCSDAASWMTGQTLLVDGGVTRRI